LSCRFPAIVLGRSVRRLAQQKRIERVEQLDQSDRQPDSEPPLPRENAPAVAEQAVHQRDEAEPTYAQVVAQAADKAGAGPLLGIVARKRLGDLEPEAIAADLVPQDVYGQAQLAAADVPVRALPGKIVV
jgi:hypothetical protein